MSSGDREGQMHRSTGAASTGQPVRSTGHDQMPAFMTVERDFKFLIQPVNRSGRPVSGERS